jgi:CHAD domain-containing protein
MEKLFIKSPSLQSEFLRISNHIISISFTNIKESNTENDELVHTLRKRVKNLRAILKILRKELGEDFYKKNNFLLRDLNRRSASIRNYFALMKLVQINIDQTEDKSLIEALNLLDLRLKSDFQNIKDNTDYKTLFGYYESLLDKYHNQLKKVEDSSNRFGNVKSGLINIYSEGKELHNECLKNPTDEHLHEWRKSVKDLYYVYFSLIPLWKNVFNAYTKEIKTLSDLLGDVNDYFELNHYIQTLIDNPFDFSLLFDLIENNRQKLITTSYQLGNRIYANSPETFADQFKLYYSSYKKEH